MAEDELLRLQRIWYANRGDLQAGIRYYTARARLPQGCPSCRHLVTLEELGEKDTAARGVAYLSLASATCAGCGCAYQRNAAMCALERLKAPLKVFTSVQVKVTCHAEGCLNMTTYRKPYCSEHLALHPRFADSFYVDYTFAATREQDHLVLTGEGRVWTAETVNWLIAERVSLVEGTWRCALLGTFSGQPGRIRFGIPSQWHPGLWSYVSAARAPEGELRLALTVRVEEGEQIDLGLEFRRCAVGEEGRDPDEARAVSDATG